MILKSVLDRSRLRGALALQTRDAVTGFPTVAACTVSAFRTSDGKLVGEAVTHPAGIRGFLTLKPGSYRIVVEPSGAGLLPSARAVTLAPPPPPPAVPPPPPAVLTALLRPSPQYRSPQRSVVLRGTAQWDLPGHPPARWAVIWARLTPPTVGITAWTRTDGRGEFSLPLTPLRPDSDGHVPVHVATLEVHANPPTAATPADPADLSDLPYDDGTDAQIRASLPIRRTLITPGVLAGADLSLNGDAYDATPAGAARAVHNTAILLS